MNLNKDPDPPDGGGTPPSNFMYQSSLMDTDDVGVIIKKVPVSDSISQYSSSSTSGTQMLTHVVPNPDSTKTSTPQNQSNSQTSAKNMPYKFCNKFEITDRGPFVVLLESTTNNLGYLHPMSIGRLIIKEHKEMDNYIHSIANAGRNRIKVTFKSPFHANILLKSQILKDKNINAFIPQYLIKRTGVIRNVDQSLTDEEIKDLLRPIPGYTFSVLEIQRLKRKIIIEGKEPEYKPTGSIKITFKGQLLPPQVYLCKVVCNVEPYVQKVIQCFNCLRYGHVNSQCKSKVRCSKCGEEHKTTDCSSTSPLSCIFCKGSHTSLNHKECPEFAKQKSIKTIMANENLSYRDAMNKKSQSFSAVVQSPIRCTPEEFPSLFENRKRRKHSPITNNKPLYIANDVTKDYSGNGVCLSQNNQSNTVNSENISALVGKLVEAVMLLTKNKNLELSECELVIKNIVKSSIDICNPNSN